MTEYKYFLTQKEQNIEMSFELNVSNDSSKPEEFSLKDTEVILDNKEQNWFKRAHIGQYYYLLLLLLLLLFLLFSSEKGFF